MKLDAAVDGVTSRRLVLSGTSVKGQFHCSECGYGVTVHRELPRCPMCAGEEWRQAAWTPFMGTYSAALRT
jgi:rubrerythrin